MGMKIGSVDPVNEIVDLHYRCAKLEKLLETLLNKGGGLGLTQSDIAEADDAALTFIQNRFPELGIKR